MEGKGLWLLVLSRSSGPAITRYTLSMSRVSWAKGPIWSNELAKAIATMEHRISPPYGESATARVHREICSAILRQSEVGYNATTSATRINSPQTAATTTFTTTQNEEPHDYGHSCAGLLNTSILVWAQYGPVWPY